MENIDFKYCNWIYWKWKLFKFHWIDRCWKNGDTIAIPNTCKLSDYPVKGYSMNGTFWSASNNNIIFGGRNYVKKKATNKCYQHLFYICITWNTKDPSIILVIGGRDGSKVRKTDWNENEKKWKKIFHILSYILL